LAASVLAAESGAMTEIRVYQIYYDAPTRAALDPGFIPLDNSTNERPDWREFWPIRKVIKEQFAAEGHENSAFYGYFSPRFAAKTRLTAQHVKTFIHAHADADVAIFCPYFDQSAFFLNVFEQGEFYHTGFMRVSEKFFKEFGIDVNLQKLVNDSTNTIFCNFFVAKQRFWREWFKVAERLFEQAENVPGSDLAKPTMHRDARDVHHKVFLMERLATLLLATNSKFVTAVHDPTALPLSTPASARFLHQAIACDALKLASRELNSARYLDAFITLRNHVFAAMRAQ
jgi:hypothetical protein